MAKKNITTKNTIQNLTAEIKKQFAYAEDIPSKVSQLTNDSNYQTGAQVEAAIAAQVGRSYRPSGSIPFAELPELTAANLGKVYNITNAFTTTDDFVEGAGKKYKAGADVGIVELQGESVGELVYKYNVFANFVDTSGLMNKITGGTAGALVKQTAEGQVEDTGIAADDLVTKVSGGTENNFAALDANGKMKDSGKKAADFVERVIVEGVEDAVIHESDIEDYTAEEIAAMLAKTPAAGE